MAPARNGKTISDISPLRECEQERSTRLGGVGESLGAEGSHELRVRVQETARGRPAASRAEVLARPEAPEGAGRGGGGGDGNLDRGDRGAVTVVCRLLLLVVVGVSLVVVGGEWGPNAVSVEKSPVPLEAETGSEEETYV